MILGVDVSTYLEQQRICKPTYKINGQIVDPLKVFYDQGVRYMRIRIWNDPYDEKGNPYLGGTTDINNCIKLATLLKGYNYKFVIDFHYSDFWVDPSKQTCPKAWKDLSFDEVNQKLYEFTKDSLQKLKDAGIDVEFVQIGNEITNGMVWPFAKLDFSSKPRGGYDELSTLLKSGIKGAKEVYPNVKTIIHLERSYDQFIYNEFFTQIGQHDVNYDIIGMSYYPYFHGTFEQLFSNIKMCQSNFHKDVMVMEFSYSFTLKDYIASGDQAKLVFNEEAATKVGHTLPEPATPEGQANYIKKFLSLAKENNVKGVFYWEPIWIPGDGICWASKSGQAYIHEENRPTRNEWANQCLFDYSGNALPALFELSEKNIK